MASRVFRALLRRHRHRPQSIPCHHFTTALLVPKPLPSLQPLFNSYRSPVFNHPQHPFLRLLSTRSRPARSKKPDIAARARQIQSRRLWAYTLTFSSVAGFIIIVLTQFQDQLVFYVTPTDCLEKYNSDPSKSKFRLGGLVLENSVTQIPSSPEIQFVITDLITDILVKYEGSLPDLFREGHSAIVEGFVKPFDDEIRKKEQEMLKNSSKLGVCEKARSLGCYFDAVEVLAKHDEKYMPAEVANAIEKNRKTIRDEEKKRGQEALVSAASTGVDSNAAKA